MGEVFCNILRLFRKKVCYAEREKVMERNLKLHRHIQEYNVIGEGYDTTDLDD